MPPKALAISSEQASTRFLERDWRAAISLVGGSILLVAFAANDGGYFPSAWGWCSLVLLWVSSIAILVLPRLELGRLEVGFLLALGAFAALTAASSLWSSSVTSSTLESQRSLVYVAGVLAVILLATPRTYGAWITAVWLAITIITAFSLATRLFPDRLGFFDPIAGYRLSEPVGYWNSLGLFAVMGAILALGFAVTSDHALRVPAAMSLPILIATLYFTFGRSAWIVLGVGLVGAVAITPARLRLMTAGLVLAAPVGLAVWICSRSDALTTQRATLADASREGHRVAVVILLATLACGALAFGLALAETQLEFGSRMRLAWGGSLVVLAGVALLLAFVRFGSPPTLVSRAYDSFQASPPRVTGSLNERLFNLSGRGRADLWRVAWRRFEDRPLLGTGAGTYERHWYEERPYLAKVRDAHSLYVETLAELGAVGLALLVVALSVPLVAALRVRRRPLVPAAVGAYVAFLVHTGADWDWEMAAVTLAALICGAAVVVAARSEGEEQLGRRVRFPLLAVLLVLVAWAGVGLMSNSALADATQALESRRLADAAGEARNARRWAPWSSRSWQLLGRAQLLARDAPQARRSFREAIDRDSENWMLWYDLARASSGRAREQALTRAAELNPLGHLIAELRHATGSQKNP